MRNVCISLMFWLCAAPGLRVHAQPSGASVRHGSVTITPGAAHTRIDQASSRAIVNWQSFSIPSGHTVEFRQPDASAAFLNRVTGADPSRLHGNLTANGRIYLINPNGIVVGNGARIDTAAFIASTLDVSDTDFLAGGDLRFSGASRASVRNLGTITASNGDVILIGIDVSNEGSISSPAGVTALAAGSEVLLSPAGDQRIQILAGVDGEALETLETGAENAGIIEAVQVELKAAGGNLYDLAVNQSGIIRATGVESRGGRILLTADQGSITHSGQLTARNADGSGGEVFAGGGLRGGDASLANARQILVTAGAVIDVSAETGDAGTAIVWADGHTSFGGTILARGGDTGGAGGFVEVSGKQTLDFRGSADLRAPAGQAGELLLDPASLTITATPPDDNLAGTYSPADFTQPSFLTNTTLQNQLALGHVTLDTSTVPFTGPDGSIVVDAPVIWTSGNRLTFESGNNIVVNQSLDGAGAEIVFGLGYVNDPLFGGQATTGNLTVDASATVRADSVVVRRNPNADLGGNLPDGPMGGIAVDGVLDLDSLDLQLTAVDPIYDPVRGGVEGSVTISNPGNRIGTLRSTVSDGVFMDDVTIVDGDGGLTVDGSFHLDGGVFTLSTPGGLILAPGTRITTTNQNIYLGSTDGSFTNQAGVLALQPGGTGRFLVYSDDPANLTADGLVANPVYNKTWTGNPPASLTQTGNRFVYSLAPTLTLTANPALKVEGDPNPTLTFSVSGLVGGDTAGEVFSGTPVLSTTADENSPGGDYTITVTQGTVTLSDFNYALDLVNGLLTVDPAALPQLIIAIQNAFRQFGESNPAFQAVFNGFIGGDDESIVTGLQVQTAATPESSVGTYTLTPFGASAPGYSIVYQPGELQITPRDVTLRAGDLSKTYGDPLPSFTSTFENLPVFANAADLGVVSFTSAATALLTPAGEYDIVPSVTGNPNYNVTPANGTATVNRRPATITAPTLSREYGLANPAFVASGSNFLSGEFNNSSLTFSTAAVQSSNVGTYGLTASGHDETNYIITYVPGQVEVTPAPLTLTANNQTREYGLPNPAFTFSDSGFRLGQGIADVVPNIDLTTAATIGSNIGTYSITFIGASLNPNYAVTFVPGNLTVTRAPLLVTPTLTSRFFGDANPDIPLTATGLRNGDTTDVITSVSVQIFASPESNVGSYPVEILSATAANYTLSFNNGILNVLQRPLTIMAEDQSREYGDANPPLTVQFDNLAPFHTPANIAGLAVTTVATPGSNVLPGGYGINVATGSNPNYDITTVPGTLTITPVPLDVTVDDASRTYASANPAFSATAGGGFKLGESEADLLLSFTTPAVPQSDVGDYLITASSPNPNYNITFEPGTLTVTPAQIAVVGTPFDRIYGDPLPANYNLNVQGLAFGATADQVVAVDDPTTRATGIGIYTYNVLSTNPNYEIASVLDNNFRILQRPINIQLGNATVLYGDPLPTFAPTNANTNLLPDLDPIEDVVTFLPLTTNPPLVGTHGVTANLINSNYSLTTTPGTLVIEPRPLIIAINNASRDYGSANPRFPFRELGPFRSVNGDDIASMLNLSTAVPSPNNAQAGFYLIRNTGNLDPLRYRLERIDFGVLTVHPRAVTLTLNRDGDAIVPSIDNLRPGDPFPFPNLTVRSFTGMTQGTVVDPNFRNRIRIPAASEIGAYAPYPTLPLVQSPAFRSDGSTPAYIPEAGYLIPGGNYAVTALNPLDNYPVARQLSDIGSITLTPTERGEHSGPERLRVGSEAAYRNNLGLLFADFPDLIFDIVMAELMRTFENGTFMGNEEFMTLYMAIFGTEKPELPFDEARIRAWLADIGANPEKRAMLGEAVVEYLKYLQIQPPGSYSEGQQRLITAVVGNVQEKRQAFADELLERQRVYEEFPAASRVHYLARDRMRRQQTELAKDALDFFEMNAGNLSEQEEALLSGMMSSIVDGDHSSSIGLIEQWLALREGEEPTAFDNMAETRLRRMLRFQEDAQRGLDAIASGTDLRNDALLNIYDIDSIGPPYKEFLAETAFAGLEAKLARYRVFSGAGKVMTTVGTGVSAGSATVGVLLVPQARNALLPFRAAKSAAKGGAKVAAGAAGGKAAAFGTIGGTVLGAGIVTAGAALYTIQAEESANLYHRLVEEGSADISLRDLDFSPLEDGVTQNIQTRHLADHIFKEMLADSIDEMLLGF